MQDSQDSWNKIKCHFFCPWSLSVWARVIRRHSRYLSVGRSSWLLLLLLLPLLGGCRFKERLYASKPSYCLCNIVSRLVALGHRRVDLCQEHSDFFLLSREEPMHSLLLHK
jgi:hypothetical protein